MGNQKNGNPEAKVEEEEDQNGASWVDIEEEEDHGKRGGNNNRGGGGRRGRGGRGGKGKTAGGGGNGQGKHDVQQENGDNTGGQAVWKAKQPSGGATPVQEENTEAAVA